MSGQFGDLRALLQRPPSRRIFQQLILLYPHGRFPPREFDYAYDHISNWPGTIRRTLPRSWFSQQRKKFANGIHLCNHVKLGSLGSDGHDFASIDNQIIEALADDDNLPSLQIFSLLDEPDSSPSLELGPLKYARGLSNLEILELSVEHGARALLSNNRLTNLRVFKGKVGVSELRSICEAARQSTWFHELVHLELNFREPEDAVSVREVCGDAYHNFLVWILEGYDFAKLVSLGLNIDPLGKETLQRIMATSALMPRLERLAVQIQHEGEIYWRTPEVFCSSRLEVLEELILDGFYIDIESVAGLTSLLDQLSTFKLYRCDYEVEGWHQYSVLQNLLEYPTELEHLTLSSNAGIGDLLLVDQEVTPARGIKCTDRFEYTDNGDDHYEDILALFDLLDLSECTDIILDRNECAFWSDAIQNLGVIPERKLSFANGRMQPGDWEYVIPMLRNNEIARVDISCNSLASGVLDLFDFETLRHISELNIAWCSLGSRHIATLEELRLRRQATLDSGEEVPPKAKIRVLDLSANELVGEALDLLGEAIDFGAVKHLDVGFNGLAPTSIEHFSSFTHLKSLNLSGNFLSAGIDRLVDILPGTLEYLDVSGSVDRLGDLVALVERFPRLDVRMAPVSDEVPEQEQAEIDRWMQHRIFIEAPAYLEVFPWSGHEHLTGTTSAESEIPRPGLVSQAPGPVSCTDPVRAQGLDDINRYKAHGNGARRLSMGNKESWENILVFVPEEWRELAKALHAHGIPAPSDTGGELMVQGVTTSTRSILEWHRGKGRESVVALIEATGDREHFDAKVIEVSTNEKNLDVIATLLGDLLVD